MDENSTHEQKAIEAMAQDQNVKQHDGKIKTEINIGIENDLNLDNFYVVNAKEGKFMNAIYKF